MTQEEELLTLREENRLLKALVAELLPLKEQLARAEARIKEPEERLAKDSRSSSRPPSSDGLGRLPRRSRPASDKGPGGQQGHAGHTLQMAEQPDEVIAHRPKFCQQCGQNLGEVVGQVVERRQVLDVPEIRLLGHEHQVQSLRCPTCQSPNLGSFPPRSVLPCNMAPICKPWRSICIRGNCCRPHAPAKPWRRWSSALAS